MTYTPKPGDIGLVPIVGNVGWLIRVGQWLNGDGFTNIQHAFVYLGNGLLIEAQPGGAQIVSLSKYQNVYWCQNLSKTFSDAARAKIVGAAKSFKGVKYSFLDYFALAARRLHIPDAVLLGYVKSTNHVICSQLCAAAYDKGGKPIWSYWTGWVTPLDLYNEDRKRA